MSTSQHSRLSIVSGIGRREEPEPSDSGYEPTIGLKAVAKILDCSVEQYRRGAGFYQQAWEHIQRLPGVRSVGAIHDLPLSGIHGGGPFTVQGHPTESDIDAPSAYRCIVSVSYFWAMGIPPLQGRGITGRGRDGVPTVLIINETAAQRYWPGQNPVGDRLSFTVGRAQPTWLEIVGVVKDVLHDGPEVAAKPTVYMPFLQTPQAFMVMLTWCSFQPQIISGKTEHIYGEVNYAAGKWPHRRRVVIKAEVVRAPEKDPKDNPRFVITNMKQSPQWIYEQVYCQRGDVENRLKELHDLEIDRTSCTSFWANQFRVLLTAAAYVLMQELRLRAAGTACARAQVLTLRERLLKLGARVMVSARRWVIHLPTSFPFLPAFRLIACRLGAQSG